MQTSTSVMEGAGWRAAAIHQQHRWRQRLAAWTWWRIHVTLSLRHPADVTSSCATNMWSSLVCLAGLLVALQPPIHSHHCCANSVVVFVLSLTLLGLGLGILAVQTVAVILLSHDLVWFVLPCITLQSKLLGKSYWYMYMECSVG